MSRYTGPVFRKSRKLKFSILENNKEFSKGKKRTTPPGQHGLSRGKKLSNYGKQLSEKQKIKYLYGVTEKQLKIIFKRATKMKGILGLNLFILLESRLDNIVYRLNLAPTRKAARQLVNHKNILVNGKALDIPSATVKINDKISLVPSLWKNKIINDNLKDKIKTLDFVQLNPAKYEGTYLRDPKREELNTEIHESYVVELFNRSIK